MASASDRDVSVALYPRLCRFAACVGPIDVEPPIATSRAIVPNVRIGGGFGAGRLPFGERRAETVGGRLLPVGFGVSRRSCDDGVVCPPGGQGWG